MPASIGVNLRVTGHCRQGGRKYMEDYFSVAYQQTEDEKDLEYAFIGIYDGHGGPEAATFAKEQLMESIVRQKNFWSLRDEDVLRAIKDGYIATHYAMWKELEKWPKTPSGLPSTAGTTASVAFIRRGKIYIGHVGDSGIVLGFQEPGESNWRARPLTKDHKPENANELSRIEQCGGKVVSKSGVPRVVWNRPRLGHRGPVRRSTPIDEIPFLAVARSLGDLWSYNSALDEFVVSPEPDTCVVPIDTDQFRCLIFGTDGLWNMLSPSMAVTIVQTAEKHNEQAILCDKPGTIVWLNPSKSLVERSLDRWSTTRLRADNTSAVTLMLDPPGPPREQVLKLQRKSTQTDPVLPENGLKIVTRYENEGKQLQVQTTGYTETDQSQSALMELNPQTPTMAPPVPKPESTAEYTRKPPHFIIHNNNTTSSNNNNNNSSNSSQTSKDCNSNAVATAAAKSGETAKCVMKPSTSASTENIQINEVSSSDDYAAPKPEKAAPACGSKVRTRSDKRPGYQSDEENDSGAVGDSRLSTEPLRKRGRQRGTVSLPPPPPPAAERNLRERNVISSLLQPHHHQQQQQQHQQSTPDFKMKLRHSTTTGPKITDKFPGVVSPRKAAAQAARNVNVPRKLKPKPRGKRK